MAPGARGGWGALTSNSQPYYRDVWALRSRRLELGGLDYDCHLDRETIRLRGSCFDVRIPTLRAHRAIKAGEVKATAKLADAALQRTLQRIVAYLKESSSS